MCRVLLYLLKVIREVVTNLLLPDSNEIVLFDYLG